MSKDRSEVWSRATCDTIVVAVSRHDGKIVGITLKIRHTLSFYSSENKKVEVAIGRPSISKTLVVLLQSKLLGNKGSRLSTTNRSTSIGCP